MYSLVKSAISHDERHYSLQHLLNSCPCCFYKLEDEENLTFDWLVTIDGNNSLKRWSSSVDGSTMRSDPCKFHTDYWLDCTMVDCFKNDVQRQSVSPFITTSLWLWNSMINRIQQQIPMTGKMSSPQINQSLHSLALTGGKMLVLNNINGCLLYLMNLASLLLLAVIGSCSSPVIWSKVVNCMTFNFNFSFNLS